MQKKCGRWFEDANTKQSADKEESKDKTGDVRKENSWSCLHNSKIYAIYSPNRCYPEYVIRYKRKQTK